MEHLATLLNVGRARGFEEKADLRGCRVNVRPQRPDCFAYSVLLLLARFFSGSPSPATALVVRYRHFVGPWVLYLTLDGNGKRNGADGCSLTLFYRCDPSNDTAAMFTYAASSLQLLYPADWFCTASVYYCCLWLDPKTSRLSQGGRPRLWGSLR